MVVTTAPEVVINDGAPSDVDVLEGPPDGGPSDDDVSEEDASGGVIAFEDPASAGGPAESDGASPDGGVIPDVGVDSEEEVDGEDDDEESAGALPVGGPPVGCSMQQVDLSGSDVTSHHSAVAQADEATPVRATNPSPQSSSLTAGPPSS